MARQLRIPSLLLALVAAAFLVACAGGSEAAQDGTDGGSHVTGVDGNPIPVEPDGGIGDTPGDNPIPVEPDGGIGDTPGNNPIPVEPDGGIGDTPGDNPTPIDPGIGDGTWLIEAPILEADVLIRESYPPQYAVAIVSELPNGCHQFEGVSMERNGTAIAITVTNRVPAESNPVCTMIYGTHEEVVELGTDFESGVEYTVTVNDRTLTFTAE
jgi:hypothetical protein